MVCFPLQDVLFQCCIVRILLYELLFLFQPVSVYYPNVVLVLCFTLLLFLFLSAKSCSAFFNIKSEAYIQCLQTWTRILGLPKIKHTLNNVTCICQFSGAAKCLLSKIHSCTNTQNRLSGNYCDMTVLYQHRYNRSTNTSPVRIQETDARAGQGERRDAKARFL